MSQTCDENMGHFPKRITKTLWRCLLKVEGIQNGVQKVVISTSYGHVTCSRNESYNYCGCYFTKNVGHTHTGREEEKSLIPFQFYLPYNIA